MSQIDLRQPPGAIHVPCHSCSLPRLKSDHLSALITMQPTRADTTRHTAQAQAPSTELVWALFSSMSVGLSSRLGSPSRFILSHVCIGIPVAWVHFAKCIFMVPPHPSVRQEAKVSPLSVVYSSVYSLTASCRREHLNSIYYSVRVCFPFSSGPVRN